MARPLGRAVAPARIGMLAIGARRPLVNPAAFNYAAGSIWMTTSRHAVKAHLLRRSPEAAFLVATGHESLLFQGQLESYDPRSLTGPIRAILGGPSLGFAVAGYVLRNAPFVGGYALDLRGMPDAWWPQNRVLLRLRVAWARTVSDSAPPAAGATPIPGVIGPALAQVGEAYTCWAGSHAPNLAPVWWAPSGPGEFAAWLPPRGLPGPPAPAGGGLVIEHHHPYRASRMAGVTLHGRVEPTTGGQSRLATAIERRYGVRPAGGTLLRLQP
ncbi:MAG: hypothetical protein J2P43_16570, partial [Candidatus Dormibacteraeota bacterium]|nr:hypothetical protein [Candidatus Dormibacteraeota bacterium]